MRVLVTGGAGYIGSVLTEVLLDSGHDVVVLDDLSKGHREAVPPQARFVEAGLADTETVGETLRSNEIEAVIHMAASSLVGESVEQPAKYYHNNMVNGLALLDSVVGAGITRFVFSSTAAVYGEPEQQPITEDAKTAPTNTYGETKLSFERALHWYRRAYGLRYASLRYFNAAGASEERGEHHDPETHLIPLVLDAVLGGPPVTVFGDDYPTPDGTCVRDYIHVIDLAQAHVLALDALDDPTKGRDGELIYNLGCGGDGYSVKQVLETVERVVGRPVPVKMGPRRAGDPAVLVASSDRIHAELGWTPRFNDLQTIVGSAWRLKEREGR